MNRDPTSAKPARANKVLYQGAEALITLHNNTIIKERIRKNYRIKILDEKLRKLRTRREAKMLEKAGNFVPKLLDVNEEAMRITMEYIDGEALREHLKHSDEHERKRAMSLVGKHLAELHEKNIIHGDLTTSNMIAKNEDVYFVDFGLSFISLKAEDKAVDLYVLKRALESTHFQHHEELFHHVLDAYKTNPNTNEVLQRLEKVEKRGRYKHKQTNT